jgi:hypothetical protein
MVTLAAVVFLFSPTTQLAAISVLLLEDRGATNQAAAFSCSIMAIVVGTLLAAHLLLRLLGAHNLIREPGRCKWFGGTPRLPGSPPARAMSSSPDSALHR